MCSPLTLRTDDRYKGNNQWVDAALSTWIDFMERRGHGSDPAVDQAPQQADGAQEDRDERAASPDSPSPFTYNGPSDGRNGGAGGPPPASLDALEQLASVGCNANHWSTQPGQQQQQRDEAQEQAGPSRRAGAVALAPPPSPGYLAPLGTAAPNQCGGTAAEEILATLAQLGDCETR